MVRSFTVPRGLTKDDITTTMEGNKLILSYKRPEPVSIPIGQQAEQIKLSTQAEKSK